MTIEQAKDIVRLMTHDGYEAEVYEEYSGRCMYGESCAAIVTDHVVMIGYYACKAGLETHNVPTRQDSMGLSLVVY